MNHVPCSDSWTVTLNFCKVPQIELSATQASTFWPAIYVPHPFNGELTTFPTSGWLWHFWTDLLNLTLSALLWWPSPALPLCCTYIKIIVILAIISWIKNSITCYSPLFLWLCISWVSEPLSHSCQLSMTRSPPSWAVSAHDISTSSPLHLAMCECPEGVYWYARATKIDARCETSCVNFARCGNSTRKPRRVWLLCKGFEPLSSPAVTRTESLFSKPARALPNCPAAKNHWPRQETRFMGMKWLLTIAALASAVLLCTATGTELASYVFGVNLFMVTPILNAPRKGAVLAWGGS